MIKNVNNRVNYEIHHIAPSSALTTDRYMSYFISFFLINLSTSLTTEQPLSESILEVL